MNVKYQVVASILLVMVVMGTPSDDAEAFGATMDINLEYAFASFIGEDSKDQAGHAVSIAGDVNGDGYDDILIGADTDEGNGESGGQTYLIFGKASGWSQELDLSHADASFLGEDEGDWSGDCVAGAGDVNNDGFDDILIGAPRLYGGRAYLIFGKATGWSMDTDLSTADVSFTGPGFDPRTGRDVAGAGDVNDDGFDDILIGACNDNRVYLVLGKGSGWSQSMDLRDADASFIGEASGDNTGWSLAGGGDVNDDGYDDILIGAWQNGEGGSTAGQTYLILGRSSGWSMNTDLSNVNASFIGADQHDLTGYSVACDGDVNDDGFDDILIGGYGDSDSKTNAGGTYLILGRASGWAMDTDLSAANASFLGESTGDFSGAAVAFAGDVDGDGYDDILIGAFYWRRQEGQSYLILGKETGWAMATSLSESDASFLGERNDDMAGWSVAGGGDVNGDGLDDLLIGSPVNDDGGDGAGKVYLLLYDDESPRIIGDSSPVEATTGDPFVFNVTVSDNIRLSGVSIEYWYGDSDTHNNVSASQRSGDHREGTWDLTLGIPSISLRTLHYIVHVSDFARHSTSSSPKDVPVLDNDAPVLDDMTPPRATTGDPFVFRLDASDNIGLAEVNVEHWYGDGDHNVTSMILESGSLWTHQTTVPSDSIEVLHFIFYASDVAGNKAVTERRDVDVLDDDAPQVHDDTPGTGTTGDPLSFSIEVSDNIGVVGAYVEYWYGSSSHRANESMMEGPTGVWTLAISVANDTEDDLHYIISVVDGGTNWATHPERVVEVKDDDTPLLVEDMSMPEAMTGAEYNVSVVVVENVAVKVVQLYYRWSGDKGWAVPKMKGKDLDPSGSGLYEHVVEMPVDSVNPFLYYITVEDSSGNVLTTEERAVSMLDVIDPVADAGEDIDIDQGDTMELDGSGSEDNIGIAQTGWTFLYDGAERTLEGEVVEHRFDIPGVYTVVLTVTDAAGNGATDSLGIVVHDVEAPVPMNQGDIDVGKGETVVFNGSRSTDNVGIVEWTWTVEYESGRRDVVTGETVEYVFDETGDHTVTLTVRDAEGNEATEAEFTVHVPNIMLGIAVILVVIAVIVGGVIVLRKLGYFRQQD